MTALDLACAEADDSLSACVIAHASPPYEILHANEAWTRQCGYSVDDVYGEHFSTLQGPSTDNAEAAAFVRRLHSQNQADCVLVNYTKDGREFLHHLSARNITDPASGSSFFFTQSHAEPTRQPTTPRS